MKGVTALIASTLDRVDKLTIEVAGLVGQIIRLEEAGKWDNKDRRKVERQVDSGDHTRERILLELDKTQRAAETSAKDLMSLGKEVESLKKRLMLSANRRWTLTKMVIGGVLTAALTVFTAWATAKVASIHRFPSGSVHTGGAKP